ncbi:MAG: response regulator [Terracidiphilus sp.]
MSDAPSSYKVLIVDDEHAISDSLAKIFVLRGYMVKTAYSAEQAIEIIAAWEPALAIVDVVLPKMTGIDLAILLRENYPLCNVLLVSGQLITSELADEAAQKGHTFDILAKPVPLPDLLETAAALLSAKAKPDA